VDRRLFLVRSGLALGSSVLAARARSGGPVPLPLDTWEAVRSQFDLDPDRVHMSLFYLASHPKPVRDAIEAFRKALDRNPVEYHLDNEDKLEASVLASAADYLRVSHEDLAMTDSTTMGLGLLYGGLKLREGQEILTTIHDHYACETSLKQRAERTGSTLRQIALYRDLRTVSQQELVDTLVTNIAPATRVVAATWVHSSTGLKLPIRPMADAIARINATRAEADRVLFCVDGVHGLGVEDPRLSDLGCDFFVAGCHKWLFGPRGTGLVWGKPTAWPAATSIIPTTVLPAYMMWMKVMPPKELPPGIRMTPGGFHSFEHRWALGEAFAFHARIGTARVTARIHELNRQLKEGLAAMPHVTLHTPMAPELSAGITCFEVKGMRALQAVNRLRQRKVIACISPYATIYARLAPNLLTMPADVETALREVRDLANGTG